MPVPTPPGTGSDQLANNLFAALVGAANATLPDLDLFDAEHEVPWDLNSDVFKPVEKVSIAEVVAEFNALMTAFRSPLEEEYGKGRITGSEYSRTFIALSTTAMQSAVQVALGKDQAFWMAAKTQADAITAANQNELMRLNAMLARAQYALTKLKLASEDSSFGVSELNRTAVIPGQVSLTTEQKYMTIEQTEAARAQTLNTRRSDGATVVGLMGIQKDLYVQQKQSYKDDTKIKAATIFSNLWVTELTMDNGATEPTPNASLMVNAMSTAFGKMVDLTTA